MAILAAPVMVLYSLALPIVLILTAYVTGTWVHISSVQSRVVVRFESFRFMCFSCSALDLRNSWWSFSRWNHPLGSRKLSGAALLRHHSRCLGRAGGLLPVTGVAGYRKHGAAALRGRGLRRRTRSNTARRSSGCLNMRIGISRSEEQRNSRKVGQFNF